MKAKKMMQPQQHGQAVLNGDERRQMIEQAAYFCAESRGFAGGCPEQDWYKAEAEIDHMLNLAD